MWYIIEDEATKHQKSVDWRKIQNVDSVVLDKSKVENDNMKLNN